MFLVACSPKLPDLSNGCNLSFPSDYVYYPPTGTPSGKRIYLYYGLNSGGLSFWGGAPMSDFVVSLRASGDEVVLASEAEPQANTCYFSDGGLQYRERFNQSINTLMNTIEATHGQSKNIIGGISYGGLHAMMGGVINGRFAAWFAHLPVTRIDALTEFAGVGNVPQFNPQYEIKALLVKPAYISWGTADTRVNWTLTKAIADQLPSIVTKQEYAGQGHTTTTQNVTDMAAWIATQ